MAKWLILDSDGSIEHIDKDSYRPSDANPTEGNPYTPWHRTDEHLHIRSGKIAGIHAVGSPEELNAIPKQCQKHQIMILEHFKPEGDSLTLSDALKYLVGVCL